MDRMIITEIHCSTKLVLYVEKNSMTSDKKKKYDNSMLDDKRRKDGLEVIRNQ